MQAITDALFTFVAVLAYIKAITATNMSFTRKEI